MRARIHVRANDYFLVKYITVTFSLQFRAD